jgi:hypothetical protein
VEGTDHFRPLTTPMDYDIRKLNDYLWELPKTGGMRVPARIYATEEMIAQIVGDKAPQQAANVAHLPGIVAASLAMPDIPLGLRLPDRWRRGVRSRRGSHLSWRRRLRHQLRRATDGLAAHTRADRAAAARSREPALPRRAHRCRRRRCPDCIRRRTGPKSSWLRKHTVDDKLTPSIARGKWQVSFGIT